MDCENFLIWNVSGLNAGRHEDVVCELVVAERSSFVCLLETKMAMITAYDVMQIVGARFDHTFLPAVGTRGGILLAWKSSIWAVTYIQ